MTPPRPTGGERATEAAANHATVDMTITGALGGGDFTEWIRHRASLLNLSGAIRLEGAARIRLRLRGAPELLDAFEVACGLGPASVLVDLVQAVAADPEADLTGFVALDGAPSSIERP